uniref:Protein-S-isoprenylcysteine O-methyltransferase n=1 Tax=Heterorhabditis bacteriophora TaxID=37862 RepID=A0A1I7X2N9_HETBA
MSSISYIGFILCIFGEILRKTAMVHAGNGFTHKLALSKRPDHRLVTSGIYSYMRHPGYAGESFYWIFMMAVMECWYTVNSV